MVLMIFALVSMTLAQAAASTTLDFQAEDAKGFAEDRIHWRSNARNDRAVWLHNIGEYLTITICLLEPMHVTVEEVRFSSDGLEKRGAILVDKNEIDTFSTAGKSDFGKNWNVFQTAGPFNKTALAKGKHTFDVLMKSSMDPWGLEIDQIVVRFEGEVRREDIVCSEEQTSSSPVTAPSDSSVLSTTASSHGPQSSTTISSSSTTFLDCTGGRCGSTSVTSTRETTSSPMSVAQTSSSSSTSIFMSTSQSTLSSTTFLTSSFEPSSEGDRQTISSPRTPTTDESDGLQSTTHITFGGFSEGTSGFDSSTDRTSSTSERTGETTQVSSITKTLVTAETSSDIGKTPNHAETVTTSFYSSTASVDVVSPSALGGETSPIDGKEAGRREHTLTDLITRDQGLTTHRDQITLGSDTSTYEGATSSAHETTTFVIPTTTEGELTMSPSERKVSQVSEVTLSERTAASGGTTPFEVQTLGPDTTLWNGETTTEIYQKTATEDNKTSISERNPEETATPTVSGEELAYNVNETWSHGKTEGVESTTQNVWLTSVGDETTSRETNTPGLTSGRERLTDGATTQSVWKTTDVFGSSGKTSDYTDEDRIYKGTTNLEGFTLSSELKTAGVDETTPVVPDTSYRAVHMLSTDETTVSVKTTPTVHEVNRLEGPTPGLGVGETTAFRETPSVYDTTQSIVKITGAEGVTTRSRDVYYTTPLDWIIASVSEVTTPPGEESGSGALTVSSVSEVTPPPGEESSSGALTVSSVSEVTPPPGEESGSGALTVSSVSEVTPPPGEESGSGALTVSSVSEVTPPQGEESGAGALTVSTVSEVTPPPGEESGSGALTVSTVSEVTPPPGEESGSGALNISNVDDLITPQEETTSPYLKQVTSEQKILATASTSSGEMSSGETQTVLSWKETSFSGKTTQSVDQYASSETTLVPRSSHGLEQTTLSAETKFDTSTSTSDKVTSVAYGTSPSTSSEHFAGFSQNSTLEQTTSASTTSRTVTANENFSFLCLRPEATTIIKRTSFSCYEGRYIFNVHVSQVTDLYLSVHNPAVPPRSKRQAALHRSTLASAGKIKHSTARDDCWSMGISLNALPEIRTVSTLRQLDVFLPAIISAFSARSLKLRFNLKRFETTLKSRNAVSFVLTMRTSCSFGSSTVDMQVRDLDTDDVVVRKMGTILYDDPTLSSSLALVIPASVLTMEIQLNFSAASHSFILDALVFEVEYDESAVGQDKVPIADSAAAYSGWVGKKDKRYFLTRTKDVRLEGINRPGTKAMTVKARRKAGNGIEIRASRLIFSGVNVESYVPRVIFDQTSRIFFFPQRDPSSQASFILGPRDPYAVDDVDSDLDEVEVDDQGDGNFTMNLTSIKYGRRSLVIGITSTTTTVLMSKMEDRFRDRLTSYIVCSFLLPCSEYGLSSQTFIRVDDAKEINAAGPWQDVTGKSVKVSRVFPV